LVLDAALRNLSKRYLSTNVVSDNLNWWRADADLIAGGASYLKLIISNDDGRMSHLITWLTGMSGAGVGETIGIRRAAIAVLADAKSEMESVLEKTLQQFGDQLYIRHASSLQQEGITGASTYNTLKLTWYCSPYPGTFALCWLCAQESPTQALHASTIFTLPQRCL
jgi:hypothetical protein